AAHRAGGGRRARLGARPVAGLAARGGLDIEFDRPAVKGVLQRDLEVVAQVRAATDIVPPATALLGAAHELAEDIVENVGEAAEILRTVTVAHTTVAEGRVAEPVISR